MISIQKVLHWYFTIFIGSHYLFDHRSSFLMKSIFLSVGPYLTYIGMMLFLISNENVLRGKLRSLETQKIYTSYFERERCINFIPYILWIFSLYISIYSFPTFTFNFLACHFYGTAWLLPIQRIKVYIRIKPLSRNV